MPNKTRMNRNTLCGFAAILLWSSTVALARSISEKLGPLTAGASVYTLGGILLVFQFFFKEKSLRKVRALSPLYLFGCGSLFLIYTVALFIAIGLALNHQQTIEVGLVNYLWPSLTILFSLALLSKKAKLWLFPGICIAFLGIILVLTQGTSISWNSFWKNLSDNPTAYGLGLIAAVSWALYSNLTRRWSNSTSFGGVPFFILATGMAMLLLRFLHREHSSWSPWALAEILFLGIATALGYLFWDMAMRQGDVILVVSVSYLTPFFSTAVGCLYLKVVPGLNLWLGCLLIIGGSLLSWSAIEKPVAQKSKTKP
jgi:drug/metabolite transporter (DMT)-like permease